MSLGLAIGCTEQSPESVADVKKFLQSSGFHKKTSKEYIWELEYDDKELLEYHKNDFWAILLTKAIRVQVIFFALYTPFEHPSLGLLQLASLSSIEKYRQITLFPRATLDVW